LPKNVGRSAARQAGIEIATGDVLLTLDSDCEPAGDSFLERHLTGLTGDVVASTGPTVGFDGGISLVCQAEVSETRMRRPSDATRSVSKTAAFTRRGSGLSPIASRYRPSAGCRRTPTTSLRLRSRIEQ